MTPDRSRRQRRIAEILAVQADRPVLSQQELRDRLEGSGFNVTQATLSRDLRALGVMKGPSGYVLPAAARAAAGRAARVNGAVPIDQGLRASLGRSLVSAEASGTLVVVKTDPGHASALALELDRMPPKGVIGTVAGDDTIFIATRSVAAAKSLMKFLRGASSGR